MRISVIAHSGSKKPRIEKDAHDTFHVYVSQSPVQGKANQAIIKAFAQHFLIKPNQISILSGANSKHKTFHLHK
ncbi:MAG: hypothetical protein A2383_03410 [Candidatus Pacebacteria bacterium RIFOXYB1_FULL_39_46]|nr:MAG: hypothetical protein A2182_01455 [Candidatus Pacebacteria bacterium RIFOXYA1_FULL_38_18]OGJ38465.1 MAG: hypothetical protein A2383_03410 [Candidatus Pacebacteria bacterium RIFOXYB1_FULL_39_46]OGJ40325.1 MAG: hypothetical protein A2411_03550 [Candidatus Pacebacteria bacterium RIFOXYC1_FULL_39_21]OGJ40898.1 MAG: hypothetical protein A2582_02290 [Candidatus Pacebacteria bacterium RIFOXYD1_FULL_39_27]